MFLLQGTGPFGKSMTFVPEKRRVALDASIMLQTTLQPTVYIPVMQRY